MEVGMHFKLVRYLAWRKSLVGNYYPPLGYVVVLYEGRVACGIYEIAGKHFGTDGLFLFKVV